MRIAGKDQLSFASRGQFYALAAKVMRDILVDKVPPSPEPRFVDFLALDEAITRLSAINPRYGRIVELRSLGGLTIDESAAILGISHATVEREWKFARAWLRRELALDGPTDRRLADGERTEP